MTHPTPNLLPSKRSRPITFTAFTPTHTSWLKKAKHNSIINSSSNPPNRLTPTSRPRLRTMTAQILTALSLIRVPLSLKS
jgi:hypothetical protein